MLKYEIVSKKPIEARQDLPKCYLADSLEEAEKIYNDFESTINRLSYRFSRAFGVDKSDLFGEALVGLSKAYKEWDPKRSESFKSYAVYYIKDAMFEYIRKNKTVVTFPSYLTKAKTNVYHINKICERYAVNYKDVLYQCIIPDIFSESDTAECMERLSNIIRASQRAMVDYEDFIKRVENFPTTVSLEDEADNVDLDTAVLVSQIKEMMDENEVKISEMIMDDKSYDEIAEQFGKTAAWVCQKVRDMRTKILENL